MNEQANKILAKPYETTETSILMTAQEIKDIAPLAEVIYPEGERIDVKKIPSTARMVELKNKEELIWLTGEAIEYRLEVLFHTDPKFNRRPSESAAAFREAPAISRERNLETNNQSSAGDQGSELDPERTLSLQANPRTGVSVEKMSEELQKMGFHLVKGPNDEPAILVDATIPAKDNTAGRFTRAENTIVTTGPGTVQERTAIISQDPDRAGFRPATEHSQAVIAIPWTKVVELHQQPGAVEYGYSELLEAPDRYDGSDVHPGDRTTAHALYRWFKDRLQDEASKAQLQQIIEIPDKVEQKVALMELLANKGLVAQLSNSGYFPYEPVYYLPRGIQQISQSTEGLQELAKLTPGRMPTRIFLESVLQLLNEAAGRHS